jgi:mannose-6-phosphate isomerase-like protein (cupin superfamily)
MMARVFMQKSAKALSLPGRTALEIVSGETGACGITLRKVEIPVPFSSEPPRSRHFHNDFEECIYVLSGEGTTQADTGNYSLKAGDVIVIPPGERHATRNTGTESLVLLCFFPTGDISKGTTELGLSAKDAEKQ